MVFVVAFVAGCTARQVEPTNAVSADKPSNHWRQMAAEDLEFIHSTIQAHHPGPLDEQNPGFAEWHERGLRESRDLLDKVSSYGGWRAVLSRYIAGFRDGHLSLNPSLEYRWVGWPRFMLAWRDQRVVVHHVEPGLAAPAPGARLIRCGQNDVEALYGERIARFRGKGIPADRYIHIPELLIDRVNPLLDRLISCTFEADGAEQTVELDWEWTSWSRLEPIYQRAAIGQRGEFAVRTVAGAGAWISLPTFAPQGDQLDQMKAAMVALPDLRQRSYIVADVRGNQGGSSHWADAFARGLYGDAYIDWIEARDARAGKDESYAVHRVSPENLQHFRDLLPRIASEAGTTSDFYRYFDALIQGMETAQRAGQPLYEHHFDFEDGKADTTLEPVKPAFGGRLYLLTDASCGSACLDFADVVLELPNAIHVGQPTSADTVYMEVRGLALPSNNGRLNFATKVYRKRKRGHNEYFTPRHEWKGDIWRTDQLEHWITALQQSHKESIADERS